jgi:DNA topoisomerase-1
MKTLVIVESPAKAHKIQTFLNNDYIVLASVGHITELAKGGSFGIGVDIEHDFKPRYILSADKISVLNDIMDAAKQCDNIIIASDPDREGEAIAWHLQDRLKDFDKPIKRAVFHEIKKSTVLKALQNVRDVDIDLFHAQEARRILDRLVGFMASPFLMNFVGPKLSAGRVQSVVTRMIIDREKEIEEFVPDEFWTIQVNLSDGTDKFDTKYSNKILDIKTAQTITNKFVNATNFIVSEVLKDEEAKYPIAPLVTSTLQRIMSKNHGFSADRTMKAAQSLYENGYCSYIRTDSVRISDEGIDELRAWLSSNGHSIPKKPYAYKNKDASQDAHECIHPTDLDMLPNTSVLAMPDEKLVYSVIWKYFMASQMTPALYNTLRVTIHVQGDKSAELKASGKALKSKGFLDILGVTDMGSIDIPNLNVGDILRLSSKNSVKLEKKQTQPTPRYSEDKLIKELVSKNIGRPATYADLLSKICSRNYVEKLGNVYHATNLGKQITEILSQHFTFMDYDYTAKMEVQLDEIGNKSINHIDMLKAFYKPFKKELDQAYLKLGGALCEKCGSPMIVRTSKKDNQKFLACSSYPKCHNTRSV